MIVMLNGAFGVGKTTIAQSLNATLPNSLIFDPEQVGFVVRKIPARLRKPEENTDDFQDIALWRTLTIMTAATLCRVSRRDLIVPMTLANPSYFDEIRTAFAQIDRQLYHFCLTASVEMIHARLLARGDGPDSWAWRQTERCVQTLASPQFAVHVDAENKTPEEIAARILKALNNGDNRSNNR